MAELLTGKKSGRAAHDAHISKSRYGAPDVKLLRTHLSEARRGRPTFRLEPMWPRHGFQINGRVE